jgi:hypothetical protein
LLTAAGCGHGVDDRVVGEEALSSGVEHQQVRPGAPAGFEMLGLEVDGNARRAEVVRDGPWPADLEEAPLQ